MVRNDTIPEVDKLKVKFITGRIIPAIATSMVVATGLVCLELCKVSRWRPQSGGLSQIVCNPSSPSVVQGWIKWDRWVIRDNPTLRELLKLLLENEMNAWNISCGICIVCNGMFPHDRERVDKKMFDFARDVAKLELPSYRPHYDVLCEDDEDNGIDILQISINLWEAFVECVPSAFGSETL